MTGVIVSVYRVEDQQGNGPYRTDELAEKYPGMYNHAYTRPGFDDLPEDFVKRSLSGEIDYEKYYFGCTSMQALFYWFGGLIKPFLKHEGFIIKKYRVDFSNIVYGDSGKQVAFKKTDAHFTF